MTDLSIVIPTIRPGKWMSIYDTIENSVAPYTWEVIFVGPYIDEIPKVDNIRTIQDYGCPSRCVQIAGLVAKGRYFTWGSDDGEYLPMALAECIDLMDNAGYDQGWGDLGYNRDDEIILKYIEGYNKQGDPLNFEDEGNPYYRGPHPEAKLGYWHAHFHDSLRFPHFPLDLRIAPLGMLATSSFNRLGGFDCRMQHINMSCIDLSLRLQKEGGKLFVSPSFVLNCDFEPVNEVHKVYTDTDYPVFKSLYGTEESAKNRQVYINPKNWIDSPPVWGRRWNISRINC